MFHIKNRDSRLFFHYQSGIKLVLRPKLCALKYIIKMNNKGLRVVTHFLNAIQTNWPHQLEHASIFAQFQG